MEDKTSLMLRNKIYTVKIGGAAGQGVKSAGLILAKFAARSGYFTYDYTEYPSLIRGGHNVMQIRFSSEAVTAPSQTNNLLVSLNQETFDKHVKDVVSGGGIMFDETHELDDSKVSSGINLYPVPLSKLAEDAGGSGILANTIALGAIAALLGGNLQTLKDLIGEQFAGKGELAEINLKAVQMGYDYMVEKFADKISSHLAPIPNQEQKMIINGNDGAALGAIAGGMQFAAIYPMSPISGILQVLAEHQEEFGFVYKQPEDEISAINMAIGASFAGARSMTATSGGGFCLMAEGLSLAGNIETPIVVIEGMRPGPATSLPTWSEQGDLQFILHSGHGDFPRIVLAAGDAKEVYELTRQAFNLADKYQTPVTVIIDKNICENDQSFSIFDTNFTVERGRFATTLQPNYLRFKDEADGISLRSVPGSGNFFMANSDEHDSQGHSSEEIEDRNIQMRKRMRKLITCQKEDMPAPTLYGPKEADVTIVSWGSNKGSILEALMSFKNVNFLQLTWMSPFPAEAVKEVLKNSKYVVDIESNYTGQMAALIREKTGYEIEDKLLKYDGRPIFPEEIVEKLNHVMQRSEQPFVLRQDSIGHPSDTLQNDVQLE